MIVQQRSNSRNPRITILFVTISLLTGYDAIWLFTDFDAIWLLTGFDAISLVTVFVTISLLTGFDAIWLLTGFNAIRLLTGFDAIWLFTGFDTIYLCPSKWTESSEHEVYFLCSWQYLALIIVVDYEMTFALKSVNFPEFQELLSVADLLMLLIQLPSDLSLLKDGFSAEVEANQS